MPAGLLPSDRPLTLETTAFRVAGECEDSGLPLVALIAGRGRTSWVFVNSTFAGFEVERDVLRRDVWPGLRALCSGFGARFQAIDLRWGGSEGQRWTSRP